MEAFCKSWLWVRFDDDVLSISVISGCFGSWFRAFWGSVHVENEIRKPMQKCEQGSASFTGNTTWLLYKEEENKTSNIRKAENKQVHQTRPDVLESTVGRGGLINRSCN